MCLKTKPIKMQSIRNKWTKQKKRKEKEKRKNTLYCIMCHVCHVQIRTSQLKINMIENGTETSSFFYICALTRNLSVSSSLFERL